MLSINEFSQFTTTMNNRHSTNLSIWKYPRSSYVKTLGLHFI